MGCQALRSEVFEPCHAHIPVQVFLAKCEEQTCEESDVCELISTYARLCRQSGVCVDWRTPHLCRTSPFDAFFFFFFSPHTYFTGFNEMKPELLPDLCVTALKCPGNMEYDACRTGCVEDCGSIQTLRGDWSVARGNKSSCMDTPTEGCFCAGGTVMHHGQCVPPEACRQCVDHRGRKYAVRHTQRQENETECVM